MQVLPKKFVLIWNALEKEPQLRGWNRDLIKRDGIPSYTPYTYDSYMIF